MESSSDTLSHRLAKSFGKSFVGKVLINSLYYECTGKARFSGNIKSLRHASSSVNSRISFCISA